MKDNWDIAESILKYVAITCLIIAIVAFVIKTVRKKDDPVVLGRSAVPRNYVAVTDGRAPQSVTITFVPIDLNEASGNPANPTTNSSNTTRNSSSGRVLGTARSNPAAPAA